MLWFAYAATFIRLGLPSPDDGYAFQHARELLAGKTLYRDVVPHIPPGSVVLQAGWIALFGDEIWVERLAWTAHYAAMLALVWACLATHFSRWRAFVLTVPMITLPTALIMCAPWYTFDAELFALLGAWIVLRWTLPERRFGWVAGAAMAASCLTKPNVGAIVSVLACIWVWRRARRQWLAFTLPIAGAGAAFFAWLVLRSDLATFLDVVVRGQAAEKGGWGMFRTLLVPLARADMPIAALVAAGAFVFAMAPRPALAVVGAAIVAGGVFLTDGPVAAHLHQVQICLLLPATVAFVFLRPRQAGSADLAPLATLALGLLTTDSISQAEPWITNACALLSWPLLLGLRWVLEGWGAVPVGSLAPVVASLAIAVAGARGKRLMPYFEAPLATQTERLTLPRANGVRVNPAYGRQLNLLLQAVVDGTRDNPAGDLFVYPEGPVLYTLTGKYSPTRLLNHARLFHSPSLIRAIEDEDIARLASRPPKYVIYLKTVRAIDGAMPRYSATQMRRTNRFVKLSAWLASRYKPVIDAPQMALLEYAPPPAP